MRASKTGRNDPCPCGSGKKYKNCCLALEGVVNRNAKTFEKYSEMIATIKVKLDQHYNSQIRKIRKPLQGRFMRLCTTPNLPQEQESIFSDWLWFDMTDSEGISFGVEYFRENGEFMDEPRRECLQALNSSYLALYEVISMEGDNLRVKNFITAQEELIMLREPLDPELVASKPLLLGRLVVLPLGAVFSGMVLILNNIDGRGEFISQHMSYLHQIKPDQEINILLKDNGEILFGIFEHACHNASLQLKDIRVLRFEDDIPNPGLALDGAEAFCLVHESGGMRWYDLRDRLGNARIGAASRYIIGYADLLDDILSMEKCLEEIIPSGKWEVVSSEFLSEPPAPEAEIFCYEALKDQEAERWLHTIHHELDDKTPQEVLHEEDGKARILNMLDEFLANTSGNAYSEDLINFMRQRVDQ